MSYPAPILNLDFVNAKQLGHPLAAFSRAYVGACYNGAGILYEGSGTSRIDHNPVTGVCEGLLVEQSASYLGTYSEQFDNAAWSKALCSIAANSATAPDGTMTMDKIVESTDNGFHAVSRSFTIESGNSVAYSVHALAGERTVLQINLNAGPDVIYARFDLAAGTVLVDATNNGSGTVFSNYKAYVEDCGKGRYRCIIRTQTTGVTSITVYHALYNGSSMYTGDGTSGLYLWGAKFQKWSLYPSSYVKSTTSAIVRAADVCSLDLSQLESGGAALFSGTEGTIVVDFKTRYHATGVRPLSLSDGTAGNYIGVALTNDGMLSVLGYVGNVRHIYNLNFGTPAQFSRYRIAFAFSGQNYAAACNGSAVLSYTAAATPAVSRLDIGSLLGLYQLGGWVRQVKVFNRYIAHAYLSALSTI